MNIFHHDNSLNRRDFLYTASAALGAATLTPVLSRAAQGRGKVKIERIETFPVRYPTVSYFKFFEGPPGTPPGRPAVIIKITANDGTVGWGESLPVQKWSYETLESATTAIQNYLAPVLIGADANDLAGIHRKMNSAIAPSFSTGMPIAKAGIDIALHDLIGRLTGTSLAQRWGRKTGGPVTLSWTLNPRSLDEVDTLIDEGLKRGFQNFNVKIAPDPTFDLAMCRIVKKRVPDGFLWADANGGYDLDTALDIAPKLADIGVPVFEQPLPANLLSGYAKLKKQGALPIIMDEGVVSPRDLIEFMKLDLLDGVALKPARCGGLLSARRQVEILRDAGMMFLGSGLTDPDISLAASLALYGAYGLEYPAALNGPQFLGKSVIKKPFKPKDGRLDVPAGPGLGIDIDETALNELVRQSKGTGTVR